jgi:hypothetical protein
LESFSTSRFFKGAFSKASMKPSSCAAQIADSTCARHRR